MKKILVLLLISLSCYAQEKAILRYINSAKETTSNSKDYYVNTLSDLQGDLSAFSGRNIYVQQSIDLGGATINIPDNATLVYDGGATLNGTLNYGANVKLVAGAYEIFGANTTHTGYISRESVDYPEWFGVKVGVVNKTSNYFAYQAWSAFALQMKGSYLLHTNITDYYYLPDRNPVDNGTTLAQGGYDWANNEGIITLHSNVTFESLEGVVIKLDGNMVYTSGTVGSWRVLRTNDQTSNVTIKNNHFIGNRDVVGDADQQHLLMTYYDNTNITVDHNIIEEFGGDAWLAQTAFNYRGGGTIDRTFELGGINYTTGAFEASSSRVRTTSATPYDLAPFSRYYMLMGASYGGYLGVKGGFFDIFFYDTNDNFLEVKRHVYMYEKIGLVPNATYAHIQLHQTNLNEEWGSRDGQPINPAMQDLYFTDGAKFTNNIVRNMGRQVVSVTGFQNMTISGNICHNITGAPGTFVDFEDARQLNRYINIFDNYVKDYVGGVFLFDAKDVNIYANHFERGSKDNLNGTFHINIPEDSENINIYDNYFYNGDVRITSSNVMHNNNFNYCDIDINAGISHDNKYYNCFLDIDDSSSFQRDEKDLAYIYNETFIYDLEGTFNDATKTDGITVRGTARTKVIVRDITILGEAKNATFRSYNNDAIINNISHETANTANGFVRSYGTGLKATGLKTNTVQQWAGDLVLIDSEFDTLLRGSSNGTITVIDPKKSFTFTGKLAADKVLYTSPNLNCETYSGNAAAVAAIGVGYYYIDSTDSNQFKITY